MTRNQSAQEDSLATIRAARSAARKAAFELARAAGSQIISRRIYPSAQSTVGDFDALAGMRACRQLELAARHSARDYIRQAREAGHSWHQIGRALELTPDGNHDPEAATLGEAAYTYVAGSPGTETAVRSGRSFTWTCRAYNRAIGDRRIRSGPADDEPGRPEGCRRLSAAIAAWHVDWEARQ